MTNYPDQIDNLISLPQVVDNLTPVRASVVNNLRDAILAIEKELGAQPSSVYGSVKARLDNVENNLSNLQIIQLSGDLGNTLSTPRVTGIQGRPVSSAAPSLDNVLLWDGIAWIPSVAPGGGGSGGAAGGDLFGNYPSPSVVKLQGNPIKLQTLGISEDGYVLTWVNSNNEYEAKPAVSFVPSNDLGGTANSQTVIGWENNPLDASSMGAPIDAQLPIWNNITKKWFSISLSGDASNTNAGIVTVTKINGTSVPAGGALTTGNVLQVNGISSLSYGPLNLGGGTNYVTGTLPAGNQASQSLAGDVSGTTAAAIVNKVNGISVPATPTANTILQAVTSTTAQWVDASLSAPTLPFPALQKHKISYFSGMTTGTGGITAGLHYWGFAGLTIAGSTSTPALATTSQFAATPRLRVSATGSSQLGIQESGIQTGWRGNATNLGGFFYRCRFSITSISTTAHVQSIVGVVASLAPAFTNWVTDTSTARVAICFDLTSSGGAFTGNWQLVECSGAAVTAHDLGANFTVNSTDYLEVIIYCAQNAASINYTINNLTSGQTVSGTMNTTIPGNTTFLAPCCKTNAATLSGGTQSLDITHLYFETYDG